MLGCETANHDNFMQHMLSLILIMLFLALQRMILEKCKNINFWKLVLADFHAILTCRPV